MFLNAEPHIKGVTDIFNVAVLRALSISAGVIDSGFSKLSCSLMTQKKGRKRPVLTPSEKQTLVYEALIENLCTAQIRNPDRVKMDLI